MTSEIQITRLERETQDLSPARLSEALELMDEFGCLILRDVI